MIAQLVNVFKIRIGVVMAITALVALLVTPGDSVSLVQAMVLTLAVLLASASAGAFNQYYERDLDALMPRTRNRPFVTGDFKHGTPWLLIIAALLIVSVGAAAIVLNITAALFVFLGAFFYAIVYTVWLKRRTWMNIVIGGASGSFAVLAGAAVVDPQLGPIPVILAVVLFLWTPPHFWSLAIAGRKDYAAAGIPMLPVVVGDQSAANAVLWNAIALVIVSILPFFFGLGWFYLLGALTGGGYFIYRSAQLAHAPSRKTAMKSFFASLVQLIVLLTFAVLDIL
ncbi:MAG: protoheme IX farnesyltransferase [marine bacterium B5-7]|nr:MAG: protoheme IX farnesyltransferase [marine bacterium B5-7]